MLEDFIDAFNRYVVDEKIKKVPDPPGQSVTTEQSNLFNNLYKNQSVTQNKDVTDENQDNLLKSNECYGVTDEKGGIDSIYENPPNEGVPF